MRDHKSGRLQNSAANTQWLCSQTASFSWKHVPGTLGHVFTKSIIGSWGRCFHWKFTPDESVLREIKSCLCWRSCLGPLRAGGRWERLLLLLGYPPAPPLTPRWHFPICCVASYALRSGLNCLQELIVQALRPQTTCQLVQVGVLLVCPSPTRGWGPHWGGY